MKKTILWSLLVIVITVVFNVVFFVLTGHDHPLSVWISYIFIHVAFILVLLTPVFVRGGRERAMFGLTLSGVGGVYFIVEFIVGLVFMIFVKNSLKITLLVQLVILGIYVVVLLINMLANEVTADSVARHEAEMLYVKNSAAAVRSIMDMTEDRGAHKKIERAYDAIAASPMRSNKKAAEIEQQVMTEIDYLRNVVKNKEYDKAKDSAEKICKLAEKRNRKVK